MLSDLKYGDTLFGHPDIQMKMKILHSVTKSLDKITISEICENAGISRQTFYRHFESKYDIPCWHTMFCRQFYLNEIGRTISWEMGYYQHLRLVSEEREFYQRSIQYSANTPFGQSILPENRKLVLFETLEKYREIEIDDNMAFLVETLSKLEYEIINGWLRSSQKTNLTQWTDDLLSIVPHRLYKALELEERYPMRRDD